MGGVGFWGEMATKKKPKKKGQRSRWVGWDGNKESGRKATEIRNKQNQAKSSKIKSRKSNGEGGDKG